MHILPYYGEFTRSQQNPLFTQDGFWVCRLSLMAHGVAMDLNHAAAILNPRGYKTFVSASETTRKLVVKRLNARLGGTWGIKSYCFYHQGGL